MDGYKPTYMMLQLAELSVTQAKGIIKNVIVKVDKFIFSVDFLIIDMVVDVDVPLLLGIHVLKTGRALINVKRGELTLRINSEEVKFDIMNTM